MGAGFDTAATGHQHSSACCTEREATHNSCAMENDALDLGTQFGVSILELASDEASYTVQQLISALNATTTLTTLTVDSAPFVDQLPPLSHSGVVEPLCQCLANLRLQNEHHPLQTVEIFDIDSDIVQQFLVALKQFGGICQVTFNSVEPFPVHFLTDFCHRNSNFKVLKLNRLTFNDEIVADPIGGSATTTLNLDKLILNRVSFKTTTAATNFAHLLSHMSVSDLELVSFDDALSYEIKMPSVDRLTVDWMCDVKHFQAALDAGMSTIRRLTVQLSEYHCDAWTMKLKSLTRMIREAGKLKSLTIHTHCGNYLSPPRQLFHALESCASVTAAEIHMNKDGNRQHITNAEVQELRRITARNSELGQFMADPITFPHAKLLTLMRQFNNCPTGLYMLMRRLPEVFSFEKGNNLFPLKVEPNPTRKLRKRRKTA